MTELFNSSLIVGTFQSYAGEGSHQWIPYKNRTAACILGEGRTLREAAAGDFDAALRLVEFINARQLKFAAISMAETTDIEDAHKEMIGYERFTDHQHDGFEYPRGVRYKKRVT